MSPVSQREWAQSFGIEGAEVIADAAAHAGKNFQVIVFAETSVIAAITAPGITNASALVGKSFPVGFQLVGNITAITLTSGSCIGYNATL